MNTSKKIKVALATSLVLATVTVALTSFTNLPNEQVPYYDVMGLFIEIVEIVN